MKNERKRTLTITTALGLITFGVGLAIMAQATTARAGLVIEDFDYTTDDDGDLKGRGGGSGWDAAWRDDGSDTIDVDINTNLNSPLYDITQSGTGLAYGTASTFSMANRDLTLGGEIWFTFLFQNANDKSRLGLMFNAIGGSGAPDEMILVIGNDFRVDYNDARKTFTDLVALGETHLVLGRFVFDGGTGNDSLEIWADPDLTSVTGPGDLAIPTFSRSDADLGSSLTQAGLASYYTANASYDPIAGIVDALRLSDGNGNADQAFRDATGIPEPGAAVLLLGVFAGLLFCRRRND